jgi:hypothetical protein
MDGYTKKNAGDIGLNVDSQGYDFYEPGLGLKVDRRFIYRDKMIASFLHFKWLHSFDNPILEQTAAFNVPGATPYTTHGLQISDDTYIAGIGITIPGYECDVTAWSVEAGYDYEYRNDNYSANHPTIRANIDAISRIQAEVFYQEVVNNREIETELTGTQLDRRRSIQAEFARNLQQKINAKSATNK